MTSFPASAARAVLSRLLVRLRFLVVATLGAYAAILRELGMPLDFPGKAGTYTALNEQTDASLFARGMVHMAVTPACANEAFNITNGDVFRWSRLWERLADFYGMRVGVVRHVKLTDWM